MKKQRLWLTALAVGVMASPLLAVTWEYVGTSAFTVPKNWMQDRKRIRFHSLVVDRQGNIFATAGDSENNGTNPGGIIIFKADNTQIDVDLSPVAFAGGIDLNIPGGITKMVVAGDGKVYALQNWLEINWDFARGWSHKILRINLDGSVDVIFNASVGTPEVPATSDIEQDKIRGLTVGGDGHVYWTMNGASGYWKYKFLWRYNVVKGTVELSPVAGNSGWSETTRMQDLLYVGRDQVTNLDWFGILSSLGDAEWRIDAMSWNRSRRTAVNGSSDPGWGRDWVTAAAYDQARKKLWVGSRNTGTLLTYGTTIMGRWNGDPANQALFTGEDDPIAGLPAVADLWHANGNIVDTSGVSNGGDYWVAALAINCDGRAWMSWGASASYNFNGTYGPIGKVYTMGPDEPGPTGDEGAPVAAETSQVVALAFTTPKVYALVCDLSTDPAAFKVYAADNPADCSGFVGACCTPSGCIMTTENECPGEFQGEGTNCDSINCSCRTCHDPFADADGDADVDQTDFAIIQMCFTGQGGGVLNSPCRCDCYDRDNDEDVDTNDLSLWILCASGPGVPADENCDD
ncbi:MAG: hypothetical protein ACUVXJ_19210 [Phycisphaerae bacterium]